MTAPDKGLLDRVIRGIARPGGNTNKPSGSILAQAVVPVLADDTAATLAARVLTQEHLIYPCAIASLLSK